MAIEPLTGIRDRTFQPVPSFRKSSLEESADVRAVESISGGRDDNALNTRSITTPIRATLSEEELDQLEAFEQARLEAEARLALTLEPVEIDNRLRAQSEMQQVQRMVIIGSLVIDVIA